MNAFKPSSLLDPVKQQLDLAQGAAERTSTRRKALAAARGAVHTS